MKKNLMNITKIILLGVATKASACGIQWGDSQYCSVCKYDSKSEHCKIWKCPLTANYQNLMAGCVLLATCTETYIGFTHYRTCG